MALAPSPLHKIQPTVKADTKTQNSSQIENIPAPVQQITPIEPVRFDAANPATWPKCGVDEVVWASDGQCHKKPVQTPSVAQAAVPTDKTAIMAAAGVKPSDYAAVNYIVSKESGWRHLVRNNEGSGAYGLCQALPATKMASAGSDYLTNPVTQMKWCNSYAVGRYGGWWAAYNFWSKNHWW